MARTYGTQSESASVAKNPASVVSVTTAAAVTLVADNPARVLLILSNYGSNTVSLSFGGTAVIGSGAALAAGQSLILREYTGVISARAATADTNVGVTEV